MPIFQKSGSLNLLEPSGPPRPIMGLVYLYLYLLNRSLVGLQSRSGCFVESKNFFLMSGFEPRIVQPVDKSYYLLRYLSCFTPKLQIGGKPVGWVSDACLRKGETGISLVKHTHTVDPVSNKQSSKTKPLDCGSVPQVRTVSHMQSPSRIADPRVPKELLVLRTALHVSPQYHVY